MRLTVRIGVIPGIGILFTMIIKEPFMTNKTLPIQIKNDSAKCKYRHDNTDNSIRFIRTDLPDHAKNASASLVNAILCLKTF